MCGRWRISQSDGRRQKICSSSTSLILSYIEKTLFPSYFLSLTRKILYKKKWKKKGKEEKNRCIFITRIGIFPPFGSCSRNVSIIKSCNRAEFSLFKTQQVHSFKFVYFFPRLTFNSCKSQVCCFQLKLKRPAGGKAEKVVDLTGWMARRVHEGG